MGDTEEGDGETPLPLWGQTARRITRLAWGWFIAAWAVLFITRSVAWLGGVDDDDIRQTFLRELPWGIVGWSIAGIQLGAAAVAILAGAVWLAASAAAGYRDPQR